MALGLGDAGVHDQAVAVFHERVAHEAELSFHPVPLTIEPRVRIGRAGMGLVRAPLATKVDLRIALLRGSVASGPVPSLGLKLFIEAQASISVPSTEKCSFERSRFTRGSARMAVRNWAAISPSSSRSRFLERVDGSQTASSMPSPTNQRNRRS